MPTKVRRLREAKRNADEAELDTLLACKPAYISDKATSDSASVANFSSKGAHNLGRGLVSSDEDGNLLLESDAMKRGRDVANATHTDIKNDQIRALQNKYRDIWGKRGMAEVIALTEGNLTVRTVQKYFRQTK
jgi:hypothetical protein